MLPLGNLRLCKHATGCGRAFNVLLMLGEERVFVIIPCSGDQVLPEGHA